MDPSKNSDDPFEQDAEMTTRGFSLAEYSQTHPYQYLKQLNNVYQSCNKSSGKDYSSASMIKLPWKKFKPVCIPKCFEQSYNMERKETCILKNSQDGQKSQEVQKQRKFWKQHEDLMKKYYRNNIATHNMKKQKMQQRRRNLFSAKSFTNPKPYNNFSLTSNPTVQTHLLNNSSKQRDHKQNNEQHMTTLKTQSDQTTQSKTLISMNQRNFSDSNLLKDTSNTYLKKRLQKSKCLNDQITIEEEVLSKLKKISMMPHLNRAKTANILSRQGKVYRQKDRTDAGYRKLAERDSLRQSRVKQGQYLEYNLKQQLISRYKSKIKEIDCSISQKNVKKTADILKEMQQLMNVDIEDY